MKTFIAVLILAYAINLSAQVDTIIKYPLQDSTSYNISSLLLNSADDRLLFFTQENDSIYMSRSIDDGVSWFDKTSIVSTSRSTKNDLAGCVTNTGRIIIVYRRENSTALYNISSPDNGETWSNPTGVAIGETYDPSIRQTDNGIIWFIFERSGQLRYRISENDGESWGAHKPLWTDANSGDIISINDTTLLLVAAFSQDGRSDYDIFGRKSYDSGDTWEEPYEIISSAMDEMRPRLIRKSNNEFELVYNQSERSYNPLLIYSDILTTKSHDDGLTWSETSKFITYVGYNGDQNIFTILNMKSDAKNVTVSLPVDDLEMDSTKQYYLTDLFSGEFISGTSSELSNFNMDMERYSAKILLLADSVEHVTGINDGLANESVPNSFRLSQNYPNHRGIIKNGSMHQD